MRPLFQKKTWSPVFLLLLCSAGCTTAPAGPPRHVRNWDQLRHGMTSQQVIDLLGDPPDQAGPMTVATQPATSPLEAIARVLILEAFDGRYERWHYGEFGLTENILSPSPRAYVVYFDSAGRVVRYRRPLPQASRPAGPYQYDDVSDTLRLGGDYLEAIARRPDGPINPALAPPVLINPPDKSVYAHYPREIVLQWSPAPGTPPDVQYLAQKDFTSDDDREFGDWSKQPEPFFTYRTGKTAMSIRFVGAQPGRWRVKAIDKTGESPWSQWRYFRFTR